MTISDVLSAVALLFSVVALVWSVVLRRTNRREQEEHDRFMSIMREEWKEKGS
jgi:uncharacterized membrane protein